MTNKVYREALVREVCRIARVTRKNQDAKTFSKRELLHLVSYLRIQENTLAELEKRVQELEQQVRRGSA